MKFRIEQDKDRGWGWNIVDEKTGRIVDFTHTKKEAERFVRRYVPQEEITGDLFLYGLRGERAGQ